MRRVTPAVWLSGLALLLTVTAVYVLAWDGEARSRDEIDARFDARAEVATTFVASLVDDIFARELAAATQHLTGAAVGAADLEVAAAGQRMPAAVLLDAEGTALAVVPDTPALVGQDLADRYAHLAGAVAGRPTVSGVVPSASLGVPVVGFALPFAAGDGSRRVFSGALDVADTPLASFLANASALSGYVGYLIDDAGAILASSTGVAGPLADVDPGLAGAVAGTVRAEGTEGGMHYVDRPVQGAPWRLLMAVPNGELHAPLAASRTSTIVVLGALGLLSAWVLGLLVLAHRRARLLAVAAATDPLTGVGNRRTLDVWLKGVPSTSTVGVLVVDLDHFKAVNDRYGHDAGDEVLMAAATRIRAVVRTSDQVVRWGGEEFAVALHAASPADAVRTAERVRSALAAPIPTAAAEVRVTASIGAAVGPAPELFATLTRADAALYEAKQRGRDRVVEADERSDALDLDVVADLPEAVRT